MATEPIQLGLAVTDITIDDQDILNRVDKVFSKVGKEASTDARAISNALNSIISELSEKVGIAERKMTTAFATIGKATQSDDSWLAAREQIVDYKEQLVLLKDELKKFSAMKSLDFIDLRNVEKVREQFAQITAGGQATFARGNQQFTYNLLGTNPQLEELERERQLIAETRKEREESARIAIEEAQKRTQQSVLLRTLDSERYQLDRKVSDINHSINRALAEREHLIKMGVSKDAEDYQVLLDKVEAWKIIRAEVIDYIGELKEATTDVRKGNLEDLDIYKNIDTSGKFTGTISDASALTEQITASRHAEEEAKRLAEEEARAREEAERLAEEQARIAEEARRAAEFTAGIRANEAQIGALQQPTVFSSGDLKAQFASIDFSALAAQAKSAFMSLPSTISQNIYSGFLTARSAVINFAENAKDTISSRFETIKERLQEIPQSVGDFVFAEIPDKIANAFSSLPSKIGGALASLPSTVKANLEVMADGVGKVISSFQRLGSIGVAALSKLGGAVKRGIGHIAQFGKQTAKSMDQAGNKMKRMTLQMIKAMLGVRGLYMLFRKMKSAFTESFKGMAEQVPELQAQFNAFKAGLAQIKGSLATAFQPIVSVVLPILTSLLSVINSVLVAIAKFNAVLTGQGYIYEYTQNQEDYAKSIEGTGKSAKKATKDLMGFDEINRLSDKDSGGGAGAGAAQYVPTAIDPTDAISEFAEKVKEAWKKADFTEVGQIIGEGLKSGMEKATDFFDTEGQKWATKLSKSLSTLINGIVSVDGLGYSIGEALGSAFNVGITFLHDFWRDTNFTGIGEQLAGAINGMFDKVDWVGLGEYFGYKFNGIFNFIDGFASDTNWDNIGVSIGTSLNSMIETMDVGHATESLSKLLVGVLQSGVSFLKTTDFKQIGEKLADGLAGIDWKGILGTAGTLLTKGAQGILDMVIGFVKKTDWAKTTQDILDGIGEMFSKVWDDGTLIQKLSEGFGSLLGAALVALWNIGSWITDNVIAPLGEALSNNFSFDPDSPWYEVGWNIIQGILKGIWDALIGIGKWIADNIVAPMVDGVCSAFGIASPSKVFMDIGLDLIAGLFDGLKGIWDAVKGLFEDLKNNILGIFNDIKSGISSIWEGIKSGASTAWNTIKTTVVNLVSSIMNVVIKQFNNIKDGVISAFQKIRDIGEMVWNGLSNIIKGVINFITQNIINGFIDGCQMLINGFIAVMNGMIDGVKFATDWIPGPDLERISDIDLSKYHVPALAEGAVLPPNQPFMAILGDQKTGTNIEAPLDTIKQAVAEVMFEQLEGMMAGFEAVVQAIQEKDTTAVISYRAIGEANNRYNNEMNRMRGYT